MVPKKLIALTAAALAALLATGWVSYGSTHVMHDALQWVNHSRDVLIVEGECREFLLRAESSGRAYALTGAPAFSAESDRSVMGLRSRLAHLRQLTSDNPAQQRALTGVSALVDRRVELLRKLAVEKRRGASLAALQSIVMKGGLVNAALDRTLDGVHAEELRLLEGRQRRAENTRLVALYAPWTMCAISALLAIWLLQQVYLALKREHVARRKSDEAARLEYVARIRAEESDRLKDDFLATVSHELRTPLTSIVGWAGLLAAARDARDELLDDAIRNIADAARNQSRLVEDLLDVSRIITGTMKLSVEPIDLPRIVDEAVASVAPSAAAKEIGLHVTAGAEIDGLVGDSSRLLQVVWNLLSNAVKFTPRGGRIDIGLQGAGSHVEITVSDTGAGIAPEFLPYVFDRFRQGESGPTRRSSGLGLGLAIVKQLVELHGGSVRASSEGAGKGSTFTVALPVIGVTRNAHVAGPLVSDSGAILTGKRIVVIEDDERTLQMLTAMLTLSGADVAAATNTADTMTLIEAEGADAIVCDIGLPGEDGLSFVRRLRASPAAYAHVPILALTAYVRPEDRTAALTAGFNSYLRKPVTREELLFAVSAMLRSGADERITAPAAL